MSDLISRAKIAIIGQKSAELASALGIEAVGFEEADGAIFVVSANDGIVSADLETWRTARDLYIPSLVVISDLSSSEIDFEDKSAIASKMLCITIVRAGSFVRSEPFRFSVTELYKFHSVGVLNSG